MTTKGCQAWALLKKTLYGVFFVTIKIMNKDVSVTLIGSFRQKPEDLAVLFKQLSSDYALLSPISIDWIKPNDEFVKSSSDQNHTVKNIEEKHLDAIRNSDVIVLFAPEGYVGVSGALEVGFAHALGIPVLSTELVSDHTIRAMVDGIFNSDKVGIDYGRGLKTLQLQYAKIAKRNGWDNESARDTMLLLTEEMGELARAVRKHAGLKRDSGYDIQLSEELADVQIYLAHLANATHIDLGNAVTDKILKNQQKKS